MQWPILPDYGCIPRWPVDGQAFIHPADVTIALRCFPSERVLRRERFDGTFYHFRYGRIRFRLRPMLWLKVQPEGIDVGDTVETVGVGMERELFVAKVWGMHYVRRKGRILYRLRRSDSVIPNLYTADQLRVLNDKTQLRAGEVQHPEPTWGGQGTKISGLDLT